MIQIMVLTMWAGAGVSAAALGQAPGESRLAWAPLAAILGPLWLSVAADRRQPLPVLDDDPHARRN